MAAIEQTYINALLADATYAANLFKNGSAQALTDALSERMTPTLAKFIGDNFEVAAHAESSDVFASGFDATVWRGRANSAYAGKIYVSMQGTLGLQDFLTDGKLTLTGNAGQQVMDMVNWWLRLSAPVGQMAKQVAYSFNPATGFVAVGSATGLGLVSAAELAGGLEVNRKQGVKALISPKRPNFRLHRMRVGRQRQRRQTHCVTRRSANLVRWQLALELSISGHLRDDGGSVLPASGLTFTGSAVQLGAAGTSPLYVLNGKSVISSEMAVHLERWLGIHGSGRASL